MQRINACCDAAANSGAGRRSGVTGVRHIGEILPLVLARYADECEIRTLTLGGMNREGVMGSGVATSYKEAGDVDLIAEGV